MCTGTLQTFANYVLPVQLLSYTFWLFGEGSLNFASPKPARAEQLLKSMTAVVKSNERLARHKKLVSCPGSFVRRTGGAVERAMNT